MLKLNLEKWNNKCNRLITGVNIEFAGRKLNAFTEMRNYIIKTI